MSSINQFPWQDDIIRRLRADGALTVEQIAAEITAGGGESEVLEEGVALNVDHLVHLGLAEYPDGRPGPSERTPHDDPDARGSYTGLSLRHDRGALVRALLEGVAFGLRDSLDLIGELGARPALGRRARARALRRRARQRH